MLRRLFVSSDPHWRVAAIAFVLLSAAFAPVLLAWVRFALSEGLYSYVLLIPLVSAVLIWQRRDDLRVPDSPSGLTGAVFAGVGVLALLGYVLAADGAPLPTQDRLAWLLSAYLFLGLAIAGTAAGPENLRRLLFPLAFLFAVVPLPSPVEAGVEEFLRRGSVQMAHLLLQWAGTPVLRVGTLLHLPGISLDVAPQCSGIRSSLVLFIVSVIAAQVCLRSPWKRALLVATVLPLAIARNGLRVFVLGELCVRTGPEILHSPLHHRGGPLFFALSLLPFGLLLWALMRSEARRLRGRGSALEVPKHVGAHAVR